MRRTLAIMATTGSILALLACGANNEAGTQLNQPATESGLHDSALRAGEAMLKSDATATYAYLSSDCKTKFGLANWSANLAAVMAISEGFLMTKFADAKIDSVETRNVTENSGDVSYAVVASDGKPISNKILKSWIYENGGWRTTDCTKLGEASASSSNTQDPPHEDLQVAESGFSSLPAESGSTPIALFAVVLNNPNTDVAALNVALNLTFYDATGGVVKSEDVQIGVVLPEGQAASANATDAPGATRMTVQVKVNRWKDAKSTGSLAVASTTMRQKTYGGTDINGIVTSTWTCLLYTSPSPRD